VDPSDGSERLTFRLGVAIGVRRIDRGWGRRDVLRFADPLDFWLWVLGRADAKRPLWIFAHNMSVDATLVDAWGRIDDGTLRLNVPCPNCGNYRKGDCKRHWPFRGACVISDPPIIIVLKSNRGVIRFIDTMNYWNTSVRRLGDSLGLPKLTRPEDTYSPGEWFGYCQRDVEIVERAVCGLMDEWERDGSGHWATTAAGLAWSAFRRYLPEKQILIDHGEPHQSMERAAYYGGQAEAYFLGKVNEPVWLYDVRSLYPWCMSQQFYPVQFLHMGKETDPAKVLQRLEFDCAVAKVIVKTEGSGYPVRIKGDNSAAAVKRRRIATGRAVWEEDRLAFPVGKYSTYLAGPELARAIRRKEVVEIQSIAWYRSAQIFREFVDHWFAKRPDVVTPENYARDVLAKTVLVSMSGYFAKHKMRWKDRPEVRAIAAWGEWFGFDAQTEVSTKFRAIGGAVQCLEPGGESRDSFPLISAYITAYGRQQLLSLRELCPEKSVLYQDTDSLMLTRDGRDALESRNLIGSGELGGLRLVRELTSLEIHAVKDYEHSSGICAAGVKDDHVKVGPGRFRQSEWESLAAQFSRTPDGSIKISTILLHLCRTRVSRRPAPDGWTVPPRLRRPNVQVF
jgi:hypothetical protein